MSGYLLPFAMVTALLSACATLDVPEVEDGAVPAAPGEPMVDAELPLTAAGDRLVGELQRIESHDSDTFVRIARAYNVGFTELRQANPEVDPWLPGEGTDLLLPTRHIVPPGPREGMVLNVAALRLFLYQSSDDGALTVVTHPVGIGREGWQTPTGTAKVISKIEHPAWYPPASIRKEHAARGDPLPAVVPPGPDNPLGDYALQLDLPGYLIHGTNQPAGVGMRVSHGCVRLYPEHIEQIVSLVPVGTDVRIVNQPVLAAWHEGRLYVEVHQPLAEDERDQAALLAQAVAGALADADQSADSVDPARIAEALKGQRGIPVPVSRSSPSVAQIRARARLVRNILPAGPPTGSESAASDSVAHALSGAGSANTHERRL